MSGGDRSFVSCWGFLILSAIYAHGGSYGWAVLWLVGCGVSVAIGMRLDRLWRQAPAARPEPLATHAAEVWKDTGNLPTRGPRTAPAASDTPGPDTPWTGSS